MHSCSQSLSEVTFNKECPKMQKLSLFKIDFSIFLWFGPKHVNGCYIFTAVLVQTVIKSHTSFAWNMHVMGLLKYSNDNWAEWRTKISEMEMFCPIEAWKCSLIFCICNKLVIYLNHVSNLIQVTSRAFRLLSAKHSFSFCIAIKSEETKHKCISWKCQDCCLCTPELWGADYSPLLHASVKAQSIVALN